MRFKTLPNLTLATYRMGLNFSIRVTPNIKSITVGLVRKHFYISDLLIRGLVKK